MVRKELRAKQRHAIMSTLEKIMYRRRELTINIKDLFKLANMELTKQSYMNICQIGTMLGEVKRKKCEFKITHQQKGDYVFYIIER